MSETVTADDGAMIPLDSIPQTFTYDGSFVATITVVYAGNTYIQTFNNDGTNITYISGWESQTLPPGSLLMITEGGDEMITETGNLMITE